jgi:alpha-glucuronidase
MEMILAVWMLAGTARFAPGETGQDAWLRYAPVRATERAKYEALPANVIALGDSTVLATAEDETVRGLTGMLARALRKEKSIRGRVIVLGTLAAVRKLVPGFQPSLQIGSDGFLLSSIQIRGFNCLVVTSTIDRGVLYGVFALLGKIARNDNVTDLNHVEQPQVPVRWIDQWDNLNGRIERGYAGGSIFFENAPSAPTCPGRDNMRACSHLSASMAAPSTASMRIPGF